MAKTTRMELIRLKRRIAFAHRGHKLLKDKRDAMMKRFMGLVNLARTSHREAQSLYGECEKLLCEMQESSSYREMLISSIREEKVLVSVKYSFVMSTRVPEYKINGQENISFSMLAPKGAERMFPKYSKLVAKTVELATLEKGIRLMAGEIETTNRRVNALENILIPRFQADAKAIEFKLGEREREMFSSLSRLT